MCVRSPDDSAPAVSSRGDNFLFTNVSERCLELLTKTHELARKRDILMESADLNSGENEV